MSSPALLDSLFRQHNFGYLPLEYQSINNINIKFISKTENWACVFKCLYRCSLLTVGGLRSPPGTPRSCSCPFWPPCYRRGRGAVSLEPHPSAGQEPWNSVMVQCCEFTASSPSLTSLAPSLHGPPHSILSSILASTTDHCFKWFIHLRRFYCLRRSGLSYSSSLAMIQNIIVYKS